MYTLDDNQSTSPYVTRVADSPRLKPLATEERRKKQNDSRKDELKAKKRNKEIKRVKGRQKDRRRKKLTKNHEQNPTCTYVVRAPRPYIPFSRLPQPH